MDEPVKLLPMLDKLIKEIWEVEFNNELMEMTIVYKNANIGCCGGGCCGES